MHCADFNSCYDSLDNRPIDAFYSATASNGFAWLNSGAFDELPVPHQSRLTSQSIDCSDHSRVFIQFQTAIATFDENAAESARLIISNGSVEIQLVPFPALLQDKAHTAPIDEIAPNQPYYVTFDITGIAANQSNVQIAWQWTANEEFAWMIDDVKLSTRPPELPEQTLWFDNFSFGLGNWTSNTIAGPDSSWQWMPGGDVSPAFTVPSNAVAFIHSETVSDGAAVFNADYYNTLGEPPMPGFVAKFYTCELISPIIDLSAVPDLLAVQFTQLLLLGNTSPFAPTTDQGASFTTSFAYSTDGGDTWSEPYDTAPYVTPATSVGLSPFENNEFYIPLPAEAGGSSDLRLKFIWAGDTYFWAIDDVAVVARPDFDMRVNRNFFARTPNWATPASQVEDIPLLADIVNNGQLSAEAVGQLATVTRQEDGAIVFQDTLDFGTVPPDSLVENNVFGQLLPASSIYLPGLYQSQYQVFHDLPDERPEDDILTWNFTVTDTVFAKEDGPTRDITPIGSIAYSYGNLFYAPNGDGWYAHHISFGVNKAEELGGDQARDIQVILYEWNDLNDNATLEEAELELLRINFHTFTNEIGKANVKVPVSIDNQGYPLEDDTHYLACIKYDYNSLPRLWMLVSDTIDYQATNFAFGETGQVRYSSALDVGNTGNFDPLGFGYDIVPVIRLHINDQPSSVKNLPLERLSVNLYPNPTRSNQEVNATFADDIALSAIIIFDMSGKVVMQEKHSGLLQKETTFAIPKLPPGSYLAYFKSSERVAIASMSITE